MTKTEAKAWSIMNPRPIPYYNPTAGEWLVEWNGLSMTSDHALILASMSFLKSYPSTEMKRVADIKFRALYSMGILEFEKLDKQVKTQLTYATPNLTNWYQNMLANHLADLGNNTKPEDVFDWFNKMFIGECDDSK